MNKFLKFKGVVEHGKKIGREIGFPTANLTNIEVDSTSCKTSMFGDPLLDLPKGVFAAYVDVNLADNYAITENRRYIGMLNIGMRPTFEGLKLGVEVHIIGFTGDLYTKELVVTIMDKIREEQKFSNKEELKAQLEKDKREVVKILC